MHSILAKVFVTNPAQDQKKRKMKRTLLREKSLSEKRSKRGNRSSSLWNDIPQTKFLKNFYTKEMNFLIKFRWSIISKLVCPFLLQACLQIQSAVILPHCSLVPHDHSWNPNLGKERRYLHYHIHGTHIMRMAGVSTANPDGTKGKDNAD